MNPSSVATEMREVKLHDSRSEGNRSIIVLGAERAAMMKLRHGPWCCACANLDWASRIEASNANHDICAFLVSLHLFLALPYLDYVSSTKHVTTTDSVPMHLLSHKLLLLS